MRIFVGIKLNILELLPEVKKCLHTSENTKIKWVDKDNHHLTFVFIGKVTEEQFYRLGEVLKKEMKSFSSFHLKTQSLGYFKKARGRSVLWLGIEQSVALGELQKAICDICNRVIPNLKIEYKEYVPHISLARYSGKINLNDNSKVIKNIELYIDEVQIIESESGSNGVEYVIRKEIIL